MKWRRIIPSANKFPRLGKSTDIFPSLGKVLGEMFQCLEKTASPVSNGWKPVKFVGGGRVLSSSNRARHIRGRAGRWRGSPFRREDHGERCAKGCGAAGLAVTLLRPFAG